MHPLKGQPLLEEDARAEEAGVEEERAHVLEGREAAREAHVGAGEGRRGGGVAWGVEGRQRRLSGTAAFALKYRTSLQSLTPSHGLTGSISRPAGGAPPRRGRCRSGPTRG